MAKTAGSVDFPTLESRILGTIYGNCLGDAIGLLTEFMVKKEASKYYGNHIKDGGLEYEHKVPDFHRSRWKNGDWTDDSDQMILIMDSIQEKGGIDAVDFGLKLLYWARHGFPEVGDFGGMGIGSTTHHVLHHNLYKADPHAAAKDIWEKSNREAAPNGGVMRTSILGVYQFEDTDKVVENCLDLCKVTHADPRCQASCVAVCCAISFMLQQKHFTNGKFNINKLIDDCFERAKEVFPKKKKDQYKELQKYMYVKNLKDLKLDESGKIGYTYKCLGAGFWALQQNDFRKALTDITMEAGDADTNGAVAGALLGCKLGYEKLPKTWTEKLYYKQWLDNKIYRFLEKFVPKVNPITLVQYKEWSLESDASKTDSKQDDIENKPSTTQDVNQATSQEPVAITITADKNIPFADDEDACSEDGPDTGSGEQQAAASSNSPMEVDEINKTSWDEEHTTDSDLAGVHGSKI